MRQRSGAPTSGEQWKVKDRKDSTYRRVSMPVTARYSISISRRKSIYMRRRSMVPDQVSDGGWGWVCVFACAFNMGTFRGLAMAFSIVNQAMQIRYQATATATSWVYSFFALVLFMSAIIIAPLCKRVGCRPVGMAGGVIYGLGMVFTAYATNIHLAYFTYGVLGGVAACIVHTTVPLVLNQYFHRHRAKATAMVYVGNSVATMIFAPVLSYLIQNHGLTTCMVVVGCVAINQTVMAALFRTPPDAQKTLLAQLFARIARGEVKVGGESDDSDDNSSVELEVNEDIPEQADTKDLDVISEVDEEILQDAKTEKSRNGGNTDIESDDRVNQSPTIKRTVYDEVEDDVRADTPGEENNVCRPDRAGVRLVSDTHSADVDDDVHTKPSAGGVRFAAVDPLCEGNDDSDDEECEPSRGGVRFASDDEDADNSTNRRAGVRFATATVGTDDDDDSDAGDSTRPRTGVRFASVTVDTDDEDSDAEPAPWTQVVDDEEEESACRTHAREFLAYYCDIDLLRRPKFLAYGMMTFFFTMSTYLVDATMAGWAQERGMSVREASWVISMACVMEIIVRLSSGFLFDIPRVRAVRTYIFGVLVMGNGFMVLLFPLAYDMKTVIVMFIAFRIFAPAIFAQETVILADIATPQKLYGALGMVRFSRSFSTLMGPVFGGMIKDALGSYDNSFFIAGSLCLFGSVTYLTVHIFHKRGRKRLPCL